MTFKDHFYHRILLLPQRQAMEFPKQDLPDNYRPAAVLLCFWPAENDTVEVVMTKRTQKVSSHRGQVSFPGGRVDPTDLSHEAAALREAHEELGIKPGHIRVMGRLDDAWSRAGHHVIPFVGWLEKKPVLVPSPDEVDEVLIADMEILMHPEASVQHEVTFEIGEKSKHYVQAFSWDGGYVWGLSADLLLELMLWIKDEPSNRGGYRLERMKKFGV